MSYSYSNPYQPASENTRSTFGAASGSSAGYQILFSGLPLDVTENQIRELLLAQPMGLPSASTQVKYFHSPTGQALGIAWIQVGSEADAERIRREYSGQVIDGTYKLSVQHVLPATTSVPLPIPAAAAIPVPVPVYTPIPANIPTKPAYQKIPTPTAPSKPNSNANANSNQAPGLKLLARMAKPGQNKPSTPREKQLALLASQKSKSAPGLALLGRLARPTQTPNHPAAKTKPKPTRTASGADKVARAKVNNGKNGMEIDSPRPAQAAGAGVGLGKKEKSKVKTQEELDEEMRVYERARRFAAA